VKPKHEGGYTAIHVELCERTLVTLLRGLGPWKNSVYLVGGLVPRFLIPPTAGELDLPPHAGTTDVDLVLDLEMMATIEAYRRLEKNLQALGFERGTNDDGRAQHFSWRMPIGAGVTVVLDLLCDSDQSSGGQVIDLPGERRLSALSIPGAQLVVEDHVEVTLTVPMLHERGIASETIRVANIVPFITLKALAYDDRAEEKDAYDLIYCMMYFGNGPTDVAAAFKDRIARWPDETLLTKTIEILRSRFASDEHTPGARKDGPVSYSRFLTDPGQQELDARRRRDAAAVIELFLQTLNPR
jgi:hypothetical protein